MLIFICEDITAHQNELKQVLTELFGENHWSLTLESFYRAEDLISTLHKRLNNKERIPEVIISDIELPGMNGIELGKELQKIIPSSYFILLTAFEEYAIQGYETRAYRYLLKPVKKEEMLQIFKDIMEQKSRDKLLLIQDGEEERLTPVQDIRYISAEDKYIIIHTVEGNYLNRNSLQYYEEVLQSFGFFRIHRKYLINMRYHKSMEGGNVILDNNEKLPISRRKVAAYHTQFLEMLEGGWLK